TTFNKLLKTRQLVMDDRVHPNDLGHHVMAQRFLKTLGIISEENFDVPFVLSERNEERYEIERKLRAIGFCEWCALYEEKKVKRMTIEEKKTILNRRAAANPAGGFVAEMAAYYNECADFKDELLEKLVELSFNIK
ncbi:MAG: hypothetical protein Q4F84_10795, partial [Fibrobacter sp.]|nr:hypothetical protein [Fibrobacter sp.]